MLRINTESCMVAITGIITSVKKVSNADTVKDRVAHLGTTIPDTVSIPDSSVTFVMISSTIRISSTADFGVLRSGVTISHDIAFSIDANVVLAYPLGLAK